MMVREMLNIRKASSAALSMTLILLSTASAQSDAKSKLEAFAEQHAEKIAAVRNEMLALSDAAINAGIEAGIIRQNEQLAALSPAERKKAAKLGDAFWLDCPAYYSAQIIFTEADDEADETARFNARTKKIRAAMMQNAQAEFAIERSYRANGDKKAAGIAGRANADPSDMDLRLFAAASALKCDVTRTKMKDTDLEFIADLIDGPYRVSLDHARSEMPADPLADATNE